MTCWKVTAISHIAYVVLNVLVDIIFLNGYHCWVAAASFSLSGPPLTSACDYTRSYSVFYPAMQHQWLALAVAHQLHAMTAYPSRPVSLHVHA